MRAIGIDVSHWNGLMNWKQAVSNGASFAFIKASQWVVDPRFVENWRNAKEAGLLRGAYHYLDWGRSEIKQAKLFCTLLKNDPGELPPVLDLELNPLPYNLTSATVSGKVWNFLTYVEKELGVTPELYTGYYYWNSYGNKNIEWSRFPFWLAWYASEAYIKLRTGGDGAPKPWKNWTFWQSTDKADGIAYGCQSVKVDRNYFNGTVAELHAWAKPVPPKLCPACGQVIA
jgi:lysozyme